MFDYRVVPVVPTVVPCRFLWVLLFFWFLVSLRLLFSHRASPQYCSIFPFAPPSTILSSIWAAAHFIHQSTRLYRKRTTKLKKHSMCKTFRSQGRSGRDPLQHQQTHQLKTAHLPVWSWCCSPPPSHTSAIGQQIDQIICVIKNWGKGLGGGVQPWMCPPRGIRRGEGCARTAGRRWWWGEGTTGRKQTVKEPLWWKWRLYCF